MVEGEGSHEPWEAVSVLAARALDGSEFALSSKSKERQDLLLKVRAGELVELELTIVAFAQIEGVRNRKSVRFKDSILGRVARSFKGAVFLRDHAQDFVEARAGTILRSKAVPVKGGKAFEMTLRVTEPWAVEKVLAGNIDRFSIGWHPGPPDTILCSACKTPIFTECYHYPGRQLDSGEVVEFIFTEAVGVEVSAVNVPAVLDQTGISDIKSALSQLAGSIAPQGHEAEDQSMNSKFALSLGLAADADEATIEAAIEAQKAQAAASASQVAQLTADNSRLGSEVEALGARQKDASIDKLFADNATKIPIQRDAAGAAVVSDLEAKLRILASSDIGAAESILASMPAATPAGKPVVSVAPAGDPAPEAISASLSAAMSQVGLSVEDLAKHNPINGTNVRRHTR